MTARHRTRRPASSSVLAMGSTAILAATLWGVGPATAPRPAAEPSAVGTRSVADRVDRGTARTAVPSTAVPGTAVPGGAVPSTPAEPDTFTAAQAAALWDGPATATPAAPPADGAAALGGTAPAGGAASGAPAPGSPATAPPATPSPTPKPTPKPSPKPPTAPPAPSGSVGVPAGTPLTVNDGDYTVTTPGAVVANLDIRGYLRIKAPNVTVQNVIVRGRPGLTGPMALVQASSTGTRIIDSELVASDPTYYIDGIVGSGFTLTRVNIHGVVDSVKITGNDVLVEDSWLHDNLYYAQVPSGGDTHNDNVQIQKGNNITIRNSVLSGTRNAALMVTQDTGPVTGLTFTGNQADNGGCTINLAEKSYGPIAATITNNRFGNGQKVPYCAVIGKTTTYAASTITGNTFTDGTPFTVSEG